MILNETIAALRRSRHLTQEELGERLGVSAQAVSKWENSISMPDVSLLPLIAEVLEVDLNALFGHAAAGGEMPTAAMAVEGVYRAALQGVTAPFGEREAWRELREELAADATLHSMTLSCEGGLYADGRLALVLCGAPKAEDILPTEAAQGVLRALADRSAMTILASFLAHRYAATVAAVSARCTMAEEEVGRALAVLVGLGLVERETVALDGERVDVYRAVSTHRLLYLLAALHLAEELARKQDHCCYYHGDAAWCF